MVHPLSHLGRRDDGAVAILTVILTSAVFIGLSALVVDLGLARDSRREAQNAADASALAAGNVVYLSDGTVNIGAVTDPINGTSAISAAKTYAFKNYGVTYADWTTCSDSSKLTFPVPVLASCISFDSSTKPKTVRVKMPTRQVSTPFAQIWGVSTVPVSAVAQVQLKSGKASCGLCVIGTDPLALGVGDIIVSEGDIAINGPVNANNANAIVTVGSGYDVNLTQTSMPNGTYPVGEPHLGQVAVEDPLAGITMPSWAGLAHHTLSCTQGPGIYVGLEDRSCTMLPGLYVITGNSAPENKLASTTNIVAPGVTLYFVCSTSGVPRPCASGGELGGNVVMAGNASLDITAPPPSAPDNVGLAIVADRFNTNTFSWRGNGGAASGTIYAASGILDYRGNGGGTLDALVVVKNMSFSGTNSNFTSTYSQAKNVIIPPDVHLSQ